MKKIMLVFGTRPEAIKMAPIVKAIEKDCRFQAITVVTAQHREMLDQVLEIFNIIPDYDLNIMGINQTLSQITTRIINSIGEVIEKEAPDIVLVHGDTTTTLATSITASYHRISIGHVEAGLRTWNKLSPFPEEINRQLTDVLADIYFAPTQQSKENLLKENHDAAKIFITGNTAIDAMKYTVTTKRNLNSKKILLTMHRRENIGKPMREVFGAIAKICKDFPEYTVVYPLHKNEKVRDIAFQILGAVPNIHLIEPMDVIEFHQAENDSYMILTDSGGIQEEAPSLGVPVLVLRDTTERPEGISSGVLKLVGTSKDKVYAAIKELIENKSEYKRMSKASNPYGDGRASEKILEAIWDMKQ